MLFVFFGLSGLIFPGDSRAYGLTDLCVETRGTRLSGCLACGRAIFLFWSSVGYSVARRGVTTRSSVVVWFLQTVISVGVFTPPGFEYTGVLEELEERWRRGGKANH
jgi:hypothetical protein